MNNGLLRRPILLPRSPKLPRNIYQYHKKFPKTPMNRARFRFDALLYNEPQQYRGIPSSRGTKLKRSSSKAIKHQICQSLTRNLFVEIDVFP